MALQGVGAISYRHGTKRMDYVCNAQFKLSADLFDYDSDLSDQSDEESEVDYPDRPAWWSDDNDSENSDEDSDYKMEEDSDNDDFTTRHFVQRKSQCCICCEEKTAFVDTRDATQTFCGLATLASHTLAELVRNTRTSSVFREDVLVGAPCENNAHAACVSCLRRVIANKSMLPTLLRQGCGYLPCLYPHGDACVNGIGQRNVYNGCMTGLLGASDACEFYSLAKSVRKAFDTPADAYNHYLAPHAPRPYPGLLRHEEVDVARAVAEYKRLASAQFADVACKVCGVFLRRATECNSLSHCGVKVCGCCGRSDIHLEEDQDHWKSCPRYDDLEPTFRVLGYMCRQGQCYTDTRECRNPDHAPGRQRVQQYKVRKQREALMRSFSTDVRRRVLAAACEAAVCEAAVCPNACDTEPRE